MEKIEVIETANLIDAHGRDVEKQLVNVIKETYPIISKRGSGGNPKLFKEEIPAKIVSQEQRKIFICGGLKFSFPINYTDEMCMCTIEAHKPLDEENR